MTDDSRRAIDAPIPAPARDLLGIDKSCATVITPLDADRDRRAQDLATKLSDAGAPQRVVDVVAERVQMVDRSGVGLGLVVTADDVVIERVSPMPPRWHVASWDTLPALAAWCAWDQEIVPSASIHVRDGSVDVTATGAARVVQAHVPADWSDDGRAVARDVAAVVADAGATVLAMSGPAHRVRQLRVHLPAEVANRLVAERTAPAGLVVGSSGRRVLDRIGSSARDDLARHVATVTAAATTEVLREFDRAVALGTAARGAVATVTALNRDLADTVLIASGGHDARWWWRRDAPTPIGVTADDLTSFGDARYGHAPAADVVVRAALAAGASVRVVPPHAAKGVRFGALLRSGVRVEDLRPVGASTGSNDDSFRRP